MTPRERIAELEVLLAEQHQQVALAQNTMLQAHVEELEAAWRLIVSQQHVAFE